MYVSFLDVALEAELCTSESPELLELAKEMCNENPSTRTTAITELRKMIFTRGECRPLRTDDAFLLRFLRAKNFIVPRAHRLLVRYCAFREAYPSLYKGVDLWGLSKVRGAYEGVIYDRPDIGRISISRIGAWDPSEYPAEDLIRTLMAVFEIAVRQPKLQVLGSTAIIDLEGVTLRHISFFTPTIAYQIVSLLGVATPTKLRSCHVINYSWTLSALFSVFKKFIPQQAMGSIFFHGNDLNSLHQHIDKECLPPRYGGTCRNHLTCGHWFKKIKQYRDENFDSEMKQMGYVIKE